MNKTKQLINNDPFCEVQLANIEHNGRQTDKFLVELQQPNSDQFTEIPGVSSVHTADYKLITNREVHDMTLQVLDDTGMDFEPLPQYGAARSTSIMWDGKRFSSRWFVKDASIELPGDSRMMMGVEALNSYDGSCKVGLAFFAMNQVCSNQFYSDNLMGRPFVFSHANRGGNLDDDIADSLQQIRTQAAVFGKLKPALELLQETRLESFDDFLDMREDMHAETGMEFRDKAVLDELTCTGISNHLGIKQPAYDDPTTLWAIANAYTAVTTHLVGGMRGAEHSRRAVDFLLNKSKELAASS